jgi:hypothetical protein
MGTNNPNFPNNVRCDEEAIQYLASLVTALKNGTFTALSGAGPFTITAAQMLAASSSSAAAPRRLPSPLTPRRTSSRRCWRRTRTLV